MKKVYQTLEQKMFYDGQERYTEKEVPEEKVKLKIKTKPRTDGKSVNKTPMKNVEPKKVDDTKPIVISEQTFEGEVFNNLYNHGEQVANENLMGNRFTQLYGRFGIDAPDGRVVLDTYALYEALKDDKILLGILGPEYYDVSVNTAAPKFKYDVKPKESIVYSLTDRVNENYRYFLNAACPGPSFLEIGGKEFPVDVPVIMFLKALIASHVNANNEFASAVYTYAISIVKMITAGKLVCPAMDPTVETSPIKKKVYEELNVTWANILKDNEKKYSKVLTQEQKDARKAKREANKKAKEKAEKEGSVLDNVVKEAKGE